MTAAEVADELEVSVATARRDLEALSAAGIPVYPQSGRGGGWSLVGGARTDLSGLSATEAQALFLLVGPAAAVSGEAKAALRKTGAGAAADLPGRRRGRRQCHHDRSHPVGRTRSPQARDGRPAAGRRDSAPESAPDVHEQRPATVRATGRPVGSRRQGRQLVSPGRDRTGTADLPGRPDRPRRIDGAARRAPRRLHTRRGVGRSGRRGGTAALDDVGDRAHRRQVRADPARSLRAALPPRRCGRRRSRPDPSRRTDPVGHRPEPRRLGVDGRGARTSIGPGRARPDRHGTRPPLCRRTWCGRMTERQSVR
ncbi:DeoR family transcriptional regulator [Rhodococcus wratislaviensis IFP 2016]|nr:DeoR family transcriptional regulator [Rhodococcus wratislaviensis IFP 2016]